MNLVGKLLIAQGGGPTAVINQSLVGAIFGAKSNPNITKIYGALHGVEGILNENFIDLTYETEDNLNLVARTPAAALQSTRVKPDRDYCERMFEVIRHHDIRYFFYIGGNDSSDTVRIVKEFADKDDYDMVVVHIPKTIDNDLMENDHSPGFGSAARFVVQSMMGINHDNSALKGVYLAVIMGRHAGFLTASSSLARIYEDDGPHLVYVPEIPFDINTFLKDVEEVYKKHKRCVVAISEGIQDVNGMPIVESFVECAVDSHGNKELGNNGILGNLLADEIKDKLNISRVRADSYGYLQRSFAGVVSQVDAREAREVGQIAAKYASIGQSGSVAIKRVGDYAVNYELVDLSLVAAKTKLMPRSFMNETGNYVSKEFIDYCRPLVGYDLPLLGKLRSPLVEKSFYKK